MLLHTLNDLEAYQPLPVRAFRQGLITGRLSHGMLCYGQPTARIYQLLQTVYAILACDERATADQYCGRCRSCHWVADNAHPGFITMSRLNYCVDDNGQDLPQDAALKLMKTPPTQIRTGQIRHLINSLARSAPYPRMVVFTDADTPLRTALAMPVTPPYDARLLQETIDPDRLWQPRPLKRYLLSTAAVNRFLKTLEEPTGHQTHLMFIAQQPDDLLDTVQSRCQLLPFQPEPMNLVPLTEPLIRFWRQWLYSPTEPLTATDRVAQLQQLSEGQPLLEVVDQALDWLQTQSSQELGNREGFRRFQQRLHRLWQCRLELAAKVQAEASLFGLLS